MSVALSCSNMNTMFITIALFVGILGHSSNGIPLESPSSDLGQFFDQRIVGGSEAAEGRAPHMAALVVGWSWTSLMCGASIISHRCLLTAAHCVPVNWDEQLLETFHATVGSKRWDSGTVVELDNHNVHPDYDPFNIKHDIAVLTTKEKIKMNERVAVIALNYDHVGGGEESFVTGWGRVSAWGHIPDYLQILYLSTIGHDTCLEALDRAANLTGFWYPPLDHEIEVCTLHSPGHGLCNGDSGSAMVSVATGKQWGVASWAVMFCARGFPDVSVKIAPYKGFIQATPGFRQDQIITRIDS